MDIILRNDQQALKNNIYSDWSHGSKNNLAVSPTGGGKSVIVSDIILDGAKIDRKQSVIAHRNELVSQMSVHIANRGIPHRIIGSNTTVSQTTRLHRKMFGRSFINPSASTAVVGVDTLIARRELLLPWTSQNDLWVIDEGHHVLKKNKWGRATEMFPNALGLGVTATPCRADGQGLGRDFDGVFDSMQEGIGMRDLINIGALSDYELACPRSDLEVNDNEVSASGDWSNQKLRKAAKKSHIVGDVVEQYCKHAYGKQAICFATDVETAGEIENNFNASGIRAVSLSAKTNPAVREKYIEEFKTGKLTILVNVDLFDEGFDVPACEVVIMARPTASLGKYRQMVGRCLRTADGKLYGLIIDHVGNVVRHGYPDKHIVWSLGRRDKRGRQEKDPDEIELKVCVFCTKPYESFRLLCPYCGKAPPLPAPRERSIEMVAGDLILLDRAVLEEMRKATQLESIGSVGSRVNYAVGADAGRRAINRQLEKIESNQVLKDNIAQWAAVERAAGFNDSEIYRKFYLTTGTDVLTALDGSRTRLEFETLAKRIEGWYS